MTLAGVCARVRLAPLEAGPHRICTVFDAKATCTIGRTPPTPAYQNTEGPGGSPSTSEGIGGISISVGALSVAGPPQVPLLGF